ncbi:sugar transferase [Anaerosporomusa subterranea]|uniref:Sugar transferase n=2 Tax=Anaerosporomusa subterranea TaxID=1794912 RepID=A0A154BSF7_ANASB|nr:sugar transferase [Anaerosporomusa subterranea]
MAKRIFDLIFTIPGVLALLPIFFAISIWVKLDSHGPVFFRQIRVGQFGREFRIYKFRTMIVDAERYGKQITVGQDKRITRSGQFLRKYKLDELPQLFNVVLGDMSLVGPRPEVPRYIAEYPEDIRRITLSVKPGITDLASITFKDENEILGNSDCPEQTYIREILPIKQGFYVRYVGSRSVWLDTEIIVRTLFAIIWPNKEQTRKQKVSS